MSAGPPAKRQTLRPWRWREQKPQLTLLTTLAAIVVASAAYQFRLGVYTDPLWLMDLCGRLLDGQTAYVDFLENSPPIAILIYMPPVLAARLFGSATEPLLVVYVEILAGAGLAACAWLLRKAGRLADVGWPGALAAAAALLMLPDYMFGQRDHIVLILALPWLTQIALRARGLETTRLAEILVGLAAGPIFAIRPQYALSFALVLAYLGWRQGFRAAVSFPEVSAAVAAAAASVVVSLYFFPYYLKVMLPIILDVYVRDSFELSFLFFNPVAVGSVLLLVGLSTWRRQLRSETLAVVALLAALGDFAGFFEQGKSIAYHCYPCVALLFVAIVTAARNRIASLEAAALATLAFLAAVYLLGAYRFETAFWYEHITIVYVCVAVFGIIAFVLTALNFGRERIPILGLAVAFAGVGFAWWVFHFEWRSEPFFLDEVRALAPNPRVAVVASFGELGHPLTSRVHGRWSLSVIALMITDSVSNIVANTPLDAAALAKLEKYKSLEEARFLADVAKNPPDAVIVDEDWARRNFNSADFESWLSSNYVRRDFAISIKYRLPEYFELYVRSKPS